MSISKDHAWDIMEKLGKIGRMHFVDLNKEEQVFNLVYEPMIKRCEATQRRITFIEDECKRYNVPMNEPNDSQDFLDSVEYMKSQNKIVGDMYFETIEREIEQKEVFIQEQTNKAKEMHENFNLLYEYRIVLRKAIKIIKGQEINGDDEMGNASFNSHSNSSRNVLARTSNIAVGHIAGTITQGEKLRFK